MNNKELTKKEESQLTPEKVISTILGGTVGEGSIDYKSEIQKYEATGQPLMETLTITDPVSKKVATYELDRGGTRDQKLAMILADPSADEQRKLGMLSLYLFERGKESASFITDLMLYKGTNTQESRKFQSRMNYDWTFFVGMFANFLFEQATTIIDAILPGEEVIAVEKEALAYLKKEAEKYEAKERKERPTLKEWAMTKTIFGATPRDIMFLEMAVRSASQAHSMKEEIQNLAEQREAAMGKPFPNIPKSV